MSTTLQNSRKPCLCNNVNVTFWPHAFASKPIGLSVVEVSDFAFKALTQAWDLFVLEHMLSCAMYQCCTWPFKGFSVCLAFFLHLLADSCALWKRFSVFALICFDHSSDFCIV